MGIRGRLEKLNDEIALWRLWNIADSSEDNVVENLKAGLANKVISQALNMPWCTVQSIMTMGRKPLFSNESSQNGGEDVWTEMSDNPRKNPVAQKLIKNGMEVHWSAEQ